jgi:hypothetical protein
LERGDEIIHWHHAKRVRRKKTDAFLMGGVKMTFALFFAYYK